MRPSARPSKIGPHGALLLAALLFGPITHSPIQAVTTSIASFDSEAELRRWDIAGQAELSAEHVTDGQSALHLTCPEGSGHIRAEGVLPADWSGHEVFRFDVYNPGPQVSLTCRVDDADGTPVSSWYMPVRTGWTTPEVHIAGLAETADVTKIARIEIRIDPPVERSVELYIDNLHFASGEPTLEYTPPEVQASRPVPDNPRNLLSNGDFELGLHDWGSWGRWDGGNYKFGTGTGPDAYSGLRSASSICDTVGRGGFFSKGVPIPEAGRYTLTFWAKASEPTRIMCGLEGGGREIALSPREELGTEWERRTLSGDIPGGIDLSVSLYHTGPGVVWFDEVSLVREGGGDAGPQADYSQLTPTSFEIRGETLFRNGEPFFPIGIYRGVPAELAGTGFNCIPGWSSGITLDECSAHGLYGMPDLTGVLRAHVPEQAAHVARPLKNHPALMAWYLCDEPDHAQWLVGPDELKLARRLLREEDPNHPSVTIVMPWADSNLYRYWDAADILATDDYVIREQKPSDIRRVARTTDVAKRAVRGTKPVWLVLQSTGIARPEEEYGVTYVALTHGANGILYWEYEDARRNPRIWETMLAIAQELKTLTPALTAPPAEVEVSAENGDIHWTARQFQDRLCLITVNADQNPAPRTEIAIAGGHEGQAEVLFEDRQIAVRAGRIVDEFRPYERHVYLLP